LVKAWLSQHRVPYAAKLLTDDANRRELGNRRLRTAPVIVIGDQELQGYDPRALRETFSRLGLLRDQADASFSEPAVQLRPQAALVNALVCADFLASSLTFVDARRGRHLGADREASTMSVPGRPISVAAHPRCRTLVSVNHEAGSVSFLSLKDGGFLHGDLERSTRRSGIEPMYALAHPRHPLFYVTNAQSRDITLFDAASGDYAFGALERSRVALPGMPGVMTLHPGLDLLYVRQREGTVTLLNALTLAPYRGDLLASTVRVGHGRALALSADGRVLHAPLYSPQHPDEPQGLALFDAESMQPLDGTPERSLRPTGATPFGIAAHPTKPLVYVACLGAHTVELRDAASGHYLNGTAENSSVPVDSGARAMLVDPRDDCLYVASFDTSTLMMRNALTGAYRFATREASSLALGQGPRDLRLLGV
jgi:6-phosphogluconolactonase (cycloisomerase 2 family)